MKRQIKTVIKDSLVGVGLGCAVIIPGISAGTIAIITNTFKKIVNAVDDLFTRHFFRALLTLLPFGIAGVLTVALLIKPFTAAMDYCLIAILALFAGFIIGSLPGVTKEVKDEKSTKKNTVVSIISFFIAASIGVLSISLNFASLIDQLFLDQSCYLYLILFAVGIIGSTGLIVPGFSGSALLLIIGFYQPILKLGNQVISFGPSFWKDTSFLATFALGVLVGFILFSKLMNRLITKHKISTYFAIISFIIGSLISIFVNSNTFAYFANGKFGLIDIICAPILLFSGFAIAFMLIKKDKNTKNT